VDVRPGTYPRDDSVPENAIPDEAVDEAAAYRRHWGTARSRIGTARRRYGSIGGSRSVAKFTRGIARVHSRGSRQCTGGAAGKPTGRAGGRKISSADNGRLHATGAHC